LSGSRRPLRGAMALSRRLTGGAGLTARSGSAVFRLVARSIPVVSGSSWSTRPYQPVRAVWRRARPPGPNPSRNPRHRGCRRRSSACRLVVDSLDGGRRQQFQAPGAGAAGHCLPASIGDQPPSILRSRTALVQHAKAWALAGPATCFRAMLSSMTWVAGPPCPLQHGRPVAGPGSDGSSPPRLSPSSLYRTERARTVGADDT